MRNFQKFYIQFLLKTSQTIAYPTESVFGLGCSPFNEKAVKNLLKLKNRSYEQGLILITNNLNNIEFIYKNLNLEMQDNLFKAIKTAKTPTTFLIPHFNKLSKLIIGKHQTVAIRITTNTFAKELCEISDKKLLVSTSANIHKQKVVENFYQFKRAFKNIYLTKNDFQRNKQASKIFDLEKNIYLR